MAKQKRMKGYAALVLTDESAAILQGMAVYETVHCHHLTLAFRPTQEEWDGAYAAIEGDTLELQVVGIASDDKGQAVLVELPEGIACKNAYPHVTISCAEGIKPKYSNELLADASKLSALDLTISAVVTFVSF